MDVDELTAVARLRASADERRQSADAKLDRRLRLQQAEDQRADTRTAAKRRQRLQARADRWARVSDVVQAVRGNAAAVWSAVVYLLAVGTAVGGQTTVAVDYLHWPWPAGLGVAGFVEGLALSMALTAHEQRMRGERALAARVLTWVAAGFAATVNGWAHADDHLAAALLAASSLAGITVWEIRSGARDRDALRANGIIGAPRPRLGAAYCARFPFAAWGAWSASVADPSIRTRGDAIAAGRTRRTGSRRTRRNRRRLLLRLGAGGGADPGAAVEITGADGWPGEVDVPAGLQRAPAQTDLDDDADIGPAPTKTDRFHMLLAQVPADDPRASSELAHDLASQVGLSDGTGRKLLAAARREAQLAGAGPSGRLG